MGVSTWLAIACLGDAPCSTLAQSLPARLVAPETEVNAAPAGVFAARRPDTTDIIVRGTRERQSSWQRGETDRVIVYSNGGENDLRRVVAHLGREYYLMSRVFGREDAPEGKIKLRVTLIGGSDFIGYETHAMLKALCRALQ